MSSRTVIIQGREWIMTDIPAPDYSNVKPCNLKFNFTYKYVPLIQPPQGSSCARASEDKSQD